MMRYPVVMFVGKARSGKDTAAKVVTEELGGVCLALADPVKRFFLKAGLTEDQLWGSAKETPFATPDPHFLGAQGPHWLSAALGGWMSPVELLRVDFVHWAQSLATTTTPRHLMQTFATEAVRTRLPDLWIDYGLFVADELLVGRHGYNRTQGFVPAGETSKAPALVAITDGRFRNEALKVKARGGQTYGLSRPTAQQGVEEGAKAHASEVEQDSIPNWWHDNVFYNSGTLEDFEAQMRYCARYDLAAYRRGSFTISLPEPLDL